MGKKRIAAMALSVIVLMAGVLTGCEKKPEVPEPVVNPPVTGGSTVSENSIYNVKDFGAKGDGSDDSLCIQAALDYASGNGGGTVYLPAGTYGVGQTIVKPAFVNMEGAGMWNTTLKWTGGDNAAILTSANEAMWGSTISDMGFTQEPGRENVVGIRGGSTLKAYNSAIGTYRNLLFVALAVGIKGDAEPAGVGIFDCLFENIFASGCTYGMQLYGSGNTILHPRLTTCKAGLVLDFLNGESFDGVHVIGGIFAANTVDILVPNPSGLRPCDFVGTWFETSEKGIISIPTANTHVMNLTFRDCMLNSNYSGEDALMDFSNAVGVVTLDSCTIIGGKRIVQPKDPASRLIMNNINVNKMAEVIHQSDSGYFEANGNGTKKSFAIEHGLGVVPSSVRVTPASEAAAAPYYVKADEFEIVITFLTAPPEGYGNLAFYWVAER